MTMKKTALSLALATAFTSSFLATSSVVNAAENPFAMQILDKGYQVAEAGEKAKDGKCGEGKCGASSTKAKDAKAASAKNAKIAKSNGDMEKHAADSKMKDGKCGEGKCGASSKAEAK